MPLRFQPARGASVLLSSTSRGASGADGADGAAATIAAGNASSLAAGATPTVTNSGSSSAATFNFGIPRGADAGIKWLYATSTSMADPSSGNIRFNNATLSSVTAIAVSATGSGSDVSDFVAAWDDSTNTTKCYIIIREEAGDVCAVFSVSAVTDNSTWLQLTVAYVSGSLTLTASDPLYVVPLLVGNKGADGAGTGDVSAAANFATDNVVIRSDGTSKGVQASVINLDDTTGTMYPTTNDSGALGKAAQSWADLFLASGAVINYANGNYTVTHSSGALTLSGTLSLGTSNALTCGTIELGHASANTLSASSGILSIEGTAILKAGRQTIFIPAGAMTARTTNGAAPGTTEMSSNKNMFKTLDFDTTTQEFAQFEVWFPKSWDLGTVTFQPVWSHASTTTNFGVVFGLAGVARSDDDAGDVAFGTAQTSTDTGGTTNDIYLGPESSATTIAGSPAAGDTVQFQVNRTVADGSDTMGIDARLHGIRLFFTTSAATDI